MGMISIFYMFKVVIIITKPAQVYFKHLDLVRFLCISRNSVKQKREIVTIFFFLNSAQTKISAIHTSPDFLHV